jgi:hypothetical protein
MPGHEISASGHLIERRAFVQGSANVLHAEQGVLVVLMEQQIAKDPESRRVPTSEQRLAFGKRLIRIMAETVLHRSHDVPELFPSTVPSWMRIEPSGRHLRRKCGTSY